MRQRWPRINASKMPFKQMENVTAFIGACRKLGVLEKDLFSTVDLYEEIRGPAKGSILARTHVYRSSTP